MLCANTGFDCDDTAESINVSASEDCLTAYDDNCDGSTNALNALNCTNFYKDADNDGYSIDEAACYCVAAGDYKRTSLSNPVDCDDTDENVNPGVAEDCLTAYDDNCDGITNQENADNCTIFYKYADSDGYSIDDTACYCVAAGDYRLTSLSNPLDCCDTDRRAKPGSTDWYPSPMEGSCSYANKWDFNCDGATEFLEFSGLLLCNRM